MHEGCDPRDHGEITDFQTMQFQEGHGTTAQRIERKIVLYFLGGVLVLATPIGRWLGASEQIALIPAVVGAVILAIPLMAEAWSEIRKGRFSSASLAALGILAAFADGKYELAGLLAFILLVAGQIVNRTAFGAQRAIQALVKLTPNIARRVEAGGEREVRLQEIKVGDVVRVRPGENLPVDGRVISGRSTINQASLTGEAAPVEVEKGEQVYAGTTNLTGGIDIEVTQVGADTTIGKVSQLIAEAEQSRTPRQLLIEQVAKFFVPVALGLAFTVWFLAGQSDDAAVRAAAAERAITVLIVACPAALLLSSPTAMVAAFAAAARLGVMVKETSYLEAAATIDTVVMDKTGTITTGKFEVSKLAPAEGVEGVDLLRAAVLGEQHSNHPLALSILATGKQAKILPDGTERYEEIHGRGVRAETSLGEVFVGRSSWLIELNPRIKSEVEKVEHRIEGMSGVHVMLGDRYLGAVGLEDKIKPGTKQVIARLRDLGVRTVAIFTGDRLSVAKRVGVSVGVDAIEAECLPEEKHQQIERYVASGRRTMMIGDGINDGPSLAAADVGVAMGLSGSDIATNSAGVALMTDELNRLPFLMELARKTRLIIAQNIAASILIVGVGLILAAAGLLDVAWAAFYHFAGEVFVLLNSFRLFRFGEAVAQAEGIDEPTAAPKRAASVRLTAAQPT